MKKILLNLTFTTLLLSVAYNQCDESNWESYYPNMEGCNLSYANLEGADLSWANLLGADLYQANLEGACLEGAINFTQTNYIGTPILEGCAGTGGDCSFEDTDEDGYDDVSYEVGYIAGHSDGVIVGMESVDITMDNQAVCETELEY